MNAKGTRFLAVLAVMAMAFAAFAVVDVTSDAAGSDVVRNVTLEKGKDITVVTEDSELSSGTAYYIGTDVDVTIGSGTYIFFVVDGKELDINATAAATVGIYSAKLNNTTSTSESSASDAKLELYVKKGVQASCLDGDKWKFPTTLTGVTALADVDLPLIADDYVEFTNGNATLYADGVVSVTAGWTLAADVVLAEDGSIALGANSVFAGTASYSKLLKAETSTTPAVYDLTVAVLALKAGANGATIAAGSIELSGEFTVQEFALAIAGEGDIVLKDVTIVASAVPEQNMPLVITADVTIETEGGPAGGLTINDGVVMTVTSTVETVGEAEITNNGEIMQGAGGDMSEAAISADSTGDFENIADPDDMKTQEQKGEATQTTVYPANQVIKIVSGTTWTLVAGTEITIKGQLYVEEGAKIIIAPGATLNITNAAIVDVLGEIVIQYEEDEDVLEPMWYGYMNVFTGSINVEGAITVDGCLTLFGDQMPFGIINIADEGIVIVNSSGVLKTAANKSELNVGYDASLIVYGSLDAETIYNAGIVLINSGVPAIGNTKIYQMADEATVSILKYTVEADLLNTIIITDEAMIISVYNIETEEYDLTTIGDEELTNMVTITPATAGVPEATADDYYVAVRDFTVVESVDILPLPLFDDIVYYYNTIIVAGEVGVGISYEGEDEAADNVKGRVTVEIDATVGAVIPEVFELSAATAGVTIVNKGALNVYGDLNAVVTSGDKSTFTNQGVVTVLEDGVAAVRDAKMNAVVNACEYVIETLTTKTYYYVSIDNALVILNTGLVEKVTARGLNTMTVSNSLPADAILTLEAESMVVIGEEDGSEVTLYVDEDAEIKGSNADIYVLGTMFAEDQSKVKKTITIHSDVKTYETDAKGKEKKDGWAKWTNLTAALNAAQPGDVVTITRDADEEYVNVRSNTTIKDGVTLVVPAGKAPLLLFDGVTLTVNGELITGEDIWAETQFGVTAKRSVNYNSSAVVVNGTLTSTLGGGIVYALSVPDEEENPVPMSDGAPIAGAYYSVGTTSVISSLPIAVDNVDYITGNITINGAVTSDPVVFTKSNTCSTIVIGNGLNADIPTILKADIMLDGSRIISTISEDAATVGNFTGAIFAGESKISATGLSGNAGIYEIADKKDKLTLSGDATLVRGESISIDTGSVFTNDFVVDGIGTVKIAAGGILEVEDNESVLNKLEVSGLLYIPNGKQITVNTLTNKGTITVVPETETKAAGQLFIEDYLYDGIASSDMVAANPVINGAIDLNVGAVAFVLNGMTMDDVAKEKFATYKSTEFYVEGKLWFTAYVVENVAHEVVDKAPIENALLTAWNTKEDMSGNDRDADDLTIGQDAKLYAKINYNIYNVVIYTDSGINSGIKSVEIDGIPMQWADNNRFVLAPGTDRLVAGDHTVKCTFVSGYTGTMSLYTEYGILLKDMKFQTSGTTDEDRNTVLFIKGSSQAIVPEPEPVPEKEVSEWNVTTILLLVLVILIAIMVVIVALKLRRS